MSLSFAQQENIGFRYIVDALRCDSPYGDARVRKLRFYAPHERDALLADLKNICAVMDTLKPCAAEYGRIEREHVHPSGTRIINVCGHQFIDIPDDDIPERAPRLFFPVEEL